MSDKSSPRNQTASLFNEDVTTEFELQTFFSQTKKIDKTDFWVAVVPIQLGESKTEFLDLDEIQKLATTPCEMQTLKQAFLFSCFTGLRWSDIMKMTWSEVRGNSKQGFYLKFQQKKTSGYETPITAQAREILGQSQPPEARVFIGLRYDSHTNLRLKQWVLKAGVYRNITFHCARHTHATLLLSSGVDIYVVSKLLGHKNIQTT